MDVLEKIILITAGVMILSMLIFNVFANTSLFFFIPLVAEFD